MSNQRRTGQARRRPTRPATAQSDEHPLYVQLGEMQSAINALQWNLTNIYEEIKDLNLERRAPTLCPKCNLQCKGELKLAEHLYNSHGGPVPQHYLDIEARSVA